MQALLSPFSLDAGSHGLGGLTDGCFRFWRARGRANTPTCDYQKWDCHVIAYETSMLGNMGFSTLIRADNY